MIKSHPYLLFQPLDVVPRFLKEFDQEEQEGIQFRLHDKEGLYEIHGQANGESHTRHCQQDSAQHRFTAWFCRFKNRQSQTNVPIQAIHGL